MAWQAELTTNATYYQTPANVTQTVIALAVQAGAPEDKMVAGFEDPNSDLDTRASFKVSALKLLP